MTHLAVSALVKRYGATRALDGVDLEAQEGELVSLLGPSGCGKTTTLRCIAGFMDPDGGDIRADGASLLAVPSHRRDFGVVFQSYALFPHLTVAENVGYGLTVRRVLKAERRRRVDEALASVKLDGLGDRLPRALSGGQQQRVALARALVIRPRLLLLDEPLANLDARLRHEVRWLIRDLQRRSRITTFYVTHDQAEAMALSDRVAVMKDGKVAQFGTPRAVYERPTESYVARFTGEANVLPVRVARGAAPGRYRVALGGADLEVAGPPGLAGEADLLLRPEHLRVADGAVSGPTLAARAVAVDFVGASQIVSAELAGGDRVNLAAPAGLGLAAGDAVRLAIDPAAAWLMARAATPTAST